MQNKYRVCVIGCGVIAPNHIKPLLENETTELVAVCDIIEERAKARAEMGNCAYYTDYHKMLEEVKPDAVHLCLPHYLHSPVAIDCMRAGADVLCEKPMDASYEAALRMKEVAEETGKRLGVIFQNRYNAENQTILQSLRSGDMGKLIALRGEVCWKRDQAYYNSGEWRSDYATAGGGVIINQAIHTLDLLRYFADSPVADVRATVSHHGDTAAEVEDTAEGLITFENGARALFYFTINNFEDEAIRVTLKCEKARVESRAGDCCIRFLDGHDVNVSNMDHAKNSGAKACYGSSHAIQIDDFYHDPDGSRARWMMDEALKTQKLVDAILKASQGVHA
ncbi:MAG: Gfo/Idh/MocA family oxidoreductase [Clostridia bacterium]|nr:Gfo/Idh/MocA family oxidoreductase [Clostridia bacterium]